MQHAVRVGYTALQATLSAPEWQTSDKPVEITVDSKTLDGEGQAAAGTLKVYALKQPDRVQRPSWVRDRSRHAAGWPGTRTEGGKKRIGLTRTRGELAEVVNEQAFQTAGNGSAKVSVALKPGIYRAWLDSKDRFGKTVTARLPIQVVDLKAKQFAVKVPNHFATAQSSVERGNPGSRSGARAMTKGAPLSRLNTAGRCSEVFGPRLTAPRRSSNTRSAKTCAAGLRCALPAYAKTVLTLTSASLTCRGPTRSSP